MKNKKLEQPTSDMEVIPKILATIANLTGSHSYFSAESEKIIIEATQQMLDHQKHDYKILTKTIIDSKNDEIKELLADQKRSFEKMFVNWEIHHKSVPCMKDDFVISEIKSFLSESIQQALAEERERVRGIIDWELTPHGYESDDPQFERFALKIKEKYKNKIFSSLDKLTVK